MNELLYWVWLSRIFPYGSDKPRKLIEVFSSPKKVYELEDSELSKLEFLKNSDKKAIKRTSLERAQMILDQCKQLGIQVIPFCSEEYPKRFTHIFAPPMVLYAKGNLKGIDEEVGITVVGTRKASEYGLRLTGNLCYELSRAGAVIISGCAEGIDTYSHWGALKAGGRTISVLGCGLDINYPASNYEMKQAILKKGALITECAPGERPNRTIFPIRNRLMAALGLGVLVTEAPSRSGSLITVEHALEQGKDVFCVPPHDIYNVNFSGVVKYLRDGAIPVFSARDVLEEYFSIYPHKLNAEMQFAQQVQKQKTLPVYQQKHSKSKPKQHCDEIIAEKKIIYKEWDDSLSELHQKMYHVMTDEPELLDEIAVKAGLSAAQAAAIATELELYDFISSYSGKRYAKHPISE